GVVTVAQAEGAFRERGPVSIRVVPVVDALAKGGIAHLLYAVQLVKDERSTICRALFQRSVSSRVVVIEVLGGILKGDVGEPVVSIVAKTCDLVIAVSFGFSIVRRIIGVLRRDIQRVGLRRKPVRQIVRGIGELAVGIQLGPIASPIVLVID